MKRVNQVFVGLLSLAFSIPLYASDPGQAIRALRKLAVSIESGVTYQDYLKLLAELRLEETTLEDSATNLDLSVLTAISAARREFASAAFIWEMSNEMGDFVPRNGAYGQSLNKRCPKNIGDDYYISHRYCRAEVWGRALENVDTAARLFRQSEDAKAKQLKKPPVRKVTPKA